MRGSYNKNSLKTLTIMRRLEQVFIVYSHPRRVPKLGVDCSKVKLFNQVLIVVLIQVL